MKKWIWGFGILIALSVMISLDLYKSHKEEKPPLPTITVGDTKVAVTLGPYTWNAEEMNQKERGDFLKEAPTTAVNPLESLDIRFSDEQPKELEVYMMESFDMDLNVMGGDFRNGQKVNIPNNPGPLIVSLEAKWEGKKNAKYYISIEREQVLSYQSLLSDDDQSYSLFFLYDQENSYDPFADSPIATGSIPISKWQGMDALHSVQELYPELNITESPTYLLFDDEKVLIQTTDDKEILQFFEDRFEPTTETLYGHIFELDYEKKIVNVHFRKFYYEKVEELKVGQEVEAEVTFNHLTDPLQTEVHSVTIHAEPPEELLVETYKAKEPNQFNLLAIGDETFFKQLETGESAEILDRVEDVHFQPNPGVAIPFLGFGFVLFDDKGAVLIAYNPIEVLEYLKKHP